MPECLICGGPMLPWLASPIDHKTYRSTTFGTAYRCSGCHYGQIWPPPDPSEIPDFYPAGYYTHGPGSTENRRLSILDRALMALAWRADYGIEFTADVANELLGGQPSDVLDLGCGAARFLAELAKRGHRCVGVDPDLAVIRPEGVTILTGTAESPPEAVRGRLWDLVIMRHSLEHTLHPELAIRTVAALLQPGAYVYVEVPNHDCASARWSGAAWEAYDVPRHLHFFTPTSLRILCEGAGLRVLREYYLRYCTQFSVQRLNSESTVAAMIRQAGGVTPWLLRLSRLHSWLLLARTALVRRSVKYEHIGLLMSRDRRS